MKTLNLAFFNSVLNIESHIRIYGSWNEEDLGKLIKNYRELKRDYGQFVGSRIKDYDNDLAKVTSKLNSVPIN